MNGMKRKAQFVSTKLPCKKVTRWMLHQVTISGTYRRVVERANSLNTWMDLIILDSMYEMLNIMIVQKMWTSYLYFAMHLSISWILARKVVLAWGHLQRPIVFRVFHRQQFEFLSNTQAHAPIVHCVSGNLRWPYTSLISQCYLGAIVFR